MAFRSYRFMHSFTFVFQEAMAKDTMERTTEPNLNIKAYLADAYLHPIFQSFEEEELVEVRVDKNQTHIPSPSESVVSSPSPPHYAYHYEVQPPPHYVHHYHEAEP